MLTSSELLEPLFSDMVREINHKYRSDKEVKMYEMVLDMKEEEIVSAFNDGRYGKFEQMSHEDIGKHILKSLEESWVSAQYSSCDDCDESQYIVVYDEWDFPFPFVELLEKLDYCLFERGSHFITDDSCTVIRQDEAFIIDCSAFWRKEHVDGIYVDEYLLNNPEAADNGFLSEEWLDENGWKPYSNECMMVSGFEYSSDDSPYEVLNKVGENYDVIFKICSQDPFRVFYNAYVKEVDDDSDS